MQYSDPLGLLTFRYPPGWWCDLAACRPGEVCLQGWNGKALLSVTLMPTPVPARAEVDAWLAAWHDRGLVGAQPVPWARDDVASTTGRDECGRIVDQTVLRGKRLDVLVWEAGSRTSGEPRLTPALQHLAATLQVPANDAPDDLTVPSPHAGGLTILQATEESDPERRVMLSRRAVNLARTRCMATFARHGQVEAGVVVSMADGLLNMGAGAFTYLHLRDAEWCLRQTLAAMDAGMGTVAASSGDHTLLSERLDLVYETQLLLGRKLGFEREPSTDPVLWAAERAYPLIAEAKRTYPASPSVAAVMAEYAVGDLLTALGNWQPDVLEDLAIALDEDILPEASTDECFPLMERLVNAARMGALSYGKYEDYSAAGELSSLAVAGRRMLPDVTAATPTMAAFLVSHATILRGLGDRNSIVRAHQLLDEVAALEPDSPALLFELSALLAKEHRGEEIPDRVPPTPDPTMSAGLLANQAIMLANQQKTDGARSYATAALAALQRPQQEVQEQPAHSADVTFTDASTVAYNRARRHHLDVRLIEAAHTTAAAFRLIGDTAPARAALAEAIRPALFSDPLSRLTAHVLADAALVWVNDQPMLAHRTSLAAAGVVEVRRLTSVGAASRLRYADSSFHQWVYANAVRMALHVSLDADACALADWSRGRVLLEAMARSPAAGHLDYVAAPAELPDEPVKRLRMLADHAIVEANRVWRRHGGQSPLSGLEVQELAALLGRHVLVVQPAGNALAVFLLDPAGPITVEKSPVDVAEIAAAVQAVAEDLGIHAVSRGGEAPLDAASDTGALRRLWEALISPVIDRIPVGAPLVVSPYPDVALLPWALLTSPGGDYLGDRNPLSATPSLAVLREVHCRLRQERTRHALLIGDPTLAPQHRATGLRQLDGALAEVKSLAMLLPPTVPSVVRLGAEATKAAYRQSAPAAQLIHVACHARLVEPAELSQLYLAAGDDGDDGTLTAAEVTDVHLEDAIVVLAACDTGQGRTSAEGVLGLGRAFLLAGARAVVLAMWKVSDVATAALIRHLYEALLARHPLDRALATAAQHTRTELAAGRLVDPNVGPLRDEVAYWAPFVVVGDGGATLANPPIEMEAGAS